MSELIFLNFLSLSRWAIIISKLIKSLVAIPLVRMDSFSPIMDSISFSRPLSKTFIILTLLFRSFTPTFLPTVQNLLIILMTVVKLPVTDQPLVMAVFLFHRQRFTVAFVQCLDSGLLSADWSEEANRGPLIEIALSKQCIQSFHKTWLNVFPVTAQHLPNKMATGSTGRPTSRKSW